MGIQPHEMLPQRESDYPCRGQYATMLMLSLIPLSAFVVLLILEHRIPAESESSRMTGGDWLLNLSGFVMQGVVIPLTGYWLTQTVLPSLLPEAQHTLALGFWGVFLLNVIGVDFLYYLQHRLFHQMPWLRAFHSTHHHAPTVNIWVTSRNALMTHFLFVYLLVNPILGYLCDSPEGFFAGAMLTAALDVFRHANIRVNLPWLKGIVTLPEDHHRHHDPGHPFVNYGANFMIWDRLLGTADKTNFQPKFPMASQNPGSQTLPVPSVWEQLLFPLPVHPIVHALRNFANSDKKPVTADINTGVKV